MDKPVHSLPQPRLPSVSAVWFYHFAAKPYQVRYFVEPSLDQAGAIQVSVYSSDDIPNPLLVTVDSHGDNIEDITYRPLFEESRGWSFRELLPSVTEVKPFLTKLTLPSIDEIADRHIAGGLSNWNRLKWLNLKDRVKSNRRSRL
jgi:hypothetical protein